MIADGEPRGSGQTDEIPPDVPVRVGEKKRAAGAEQSPHETEERLEVPPFVRNVGTHDNVKPLRDLRVPPVHAANRHPGELSGIKVRCSIEPCELKRIFFVIRHHDGGSRLRCRDTCETEPASQLEQILPRQPGSLPQMSGQHGRGRPEIGPVGQPPVSLEPLGSDCFEKPVGIADRKE